MRAIIGILLTIMLLAWLAEQEFKDEADREIKGLWPACRHK